MQLKLTTDYALHLLCRLANERFPLSVPELSEDLGIPKRYTAKVMGMLKEAGLVESTSGTKGGYELAGSPCKVTLLDVVKAVEGTTDVSPRQQDPETRYSSNPGADRRIRQAYHILQQGVEFGLARITVADLLKDEDLTFAQIHAIWRAEHE